MTSEIILVFKVCSYFRRTIIFSLALMNLLQCSCLENPRDGGAWWVAIYGVAQSQTRLKRLSSSSFNEAYLTTKNYIYLKLQHDVLMYVYRHPAYLIHKKSTSQEMPGWMNHKQESRLPREISITSVMQMTPPYQQKAKRN